MLAKFILFLLLTAPRHELHKDTKALDETVRGCVDSEQLFGFPASFVAYTIFLESAFYPKIISTSVRKEVGYAQVHGVYKNRCKKRGFDPKDRHGGAMCVGLVLSEGLDKCKTFQKAVQFYRSGHCNRAKKSAKWRIDSWRKKIDQFNSRQSK